MNGENPGTDVEPITDAEIVPAQRPAGWMRRTMRTFLRRTHPTVRHIDSRLGSPGDVRPPLHERLDVVERYLAHLAGQNDRTLGHLEMLALQARMDDIQQHLELLGRKADLGVQATQDLHRGLSVSLDLMRAGMEERLDALNHAMGEPAHRGASATPEDVSIAFTTAALAALPRKARVLVRSADPRVSASLSALGLSVVASNPDAAGRGVRVIEPKTAKQREWSAVIAHDSEQSPERAGRLVARGGVLVHSSAWEDRHDVPRGWEVQRSAALWRTLTGGWTAGDADTPLSEEGLVLLALRRG